MSFRFYVVVLLLLFALFTNDGESEASLSASKLPDVFVIVIDALRADHVGAYHYKRDTTPFIDTLAEKGIVFERAYSPSSFTRESVSALFMGRYPSSTPWSMGWMAQVDPEVKTMAECFMENGYYTVFCTDQPALEPEMFGKGFNLVEYYTDQYNTSGNGDKIAENLIKKVSELTSEVPLFVYMHFYDPHSPYEPYPSFYLRFADRIFLAPLRLYDEVRFNLPKLVEQGFGPGEPRFEDLVLRYDAEIAMVDESVRRVYESISRLRKGREILWIITADHGEEFLEHGFVEHAWRLYLESIHIPLIINLSPGSNVGIRIPDEVSLVDIFPTLTKYLNFSFNDGWDGVALPLNEWLKGKKEPQGVDRVIISEINIPTRNIGMSLIKGGWQYLCWQKWLTWEECSEYASKQGALREELFQGGLEFPKFCSQPVYEEFIGPDENGYPRKSVSFKDNEVVFLRLREIMKDWCSKRPGMKSDIEKKRYSDDRKQRTRESTMKDNGSNQPIESQGERFDPLKGAGYL